MESTILIVSAVRNEAPHIARVVEAVAAQERPPDRWVVIDDGSTDGTLERLMELERELPFMSVIEAPRDPSLEFARDRLAVAAEIRTFNHGLRTVDPRAFAYVMKLDGDIELPTSYLRVLSERFAANPRLGLAGGVLVEPSPDGRMRPVAIPPHHVHGALKLYSIECLTAIGGIPERLGWDTIDGTYARMRGFDTVAFPDLVCVHHRPLASADGRLRGRARHGECAYIAHYPPLWVAMRSLKVACRPPVGASGAAFAFGYARARLRRVPRVPDAEYRDFTRRELRARMAQPLLRAIGWPRGGGRADHDPKEHHQMPIQQVHHAGERNRG